MAFDAFIKIDGIPGESVDDAHKSEIEVLSFSFGVTNTGSGAIGGGGGAGRADFQDFHFVSRLQKSSPTLMLACATGEHIKSALLSVRHAVVGRTFEDFYKVRLSDVLVSSFQQGGTADGEEPVPTDQISLAFQKIEVTYTVQDRKGVLGESVDVAFDLRQDVAGG